MAQSSFQLARRKGAWSARPENFLYLDGLSKRVLMEVALHLAATTTGQYEAALAGGQALEQVRTEVRNLRNANLI